MTEKEIIKLCIEHDLQHLLNKQSTQMLYNELLQSKEITIHEGKFYLTGLVSDELGLEEFVVKYRELFSFKRSGIKGRSGDNKTVKKKAKRFSLEMSMSYVDILSLTEWYTNNYKDVTGYLCSANYFLYKQDVRKQEHSWAKTILEEWQQEQEDKDMFETNE